MSYVGTSQSEHIVGGAVEEEVERAIKDSELSAHHKAEFATHYIMERFRTDLVVGEALADLQAPGGAQQ